MSDTHTFEPRSPAMSRLEAEFEIGRVLGLGGTSEVRVAYQARHERCVAVKIATSPFGERALATELRAASKLDHPGVLPVLASGRDEQGRAAIVMQLVVGRTWRQFISPTGRLTAPARWMGSPLSWHLGVVCQVAEVLEHAHGLGIIHRDVKPANVMIDQHGKVHLMDWGLAAAIDDRQPQLPRCADIRRFVGTTGHAAPEMIDTRSPLIGVCTDVYQLGSCLHMLLTGQPPHTDEEVSARLRSALLSEPACYPTTAPEHLVAICHRAMARQPSQRFATMAALREAVQAARLETRSTELARRGMQALVALRTRIAAGADGLEVGELFARGRDAFRRALRYWSRNALALDGYQSLCEAIIHHDLANTRFERARARLARLPRPRPDLEARLEAVAAAHGPRVAERPAGAEAPRPVTLRTDRPQPALSSPRPRAASVATYAIGQAA